MTKAKKTLTYYGVSPNKQFNLTLYRYIDLFFLNPFLNYLENHSIIFRTPMEDKV